MFFFYGESYTGIRKKKYKCFYHKCFFILKRSRQHLIPLSMIDQKLSLDIHRLLSFSIWTKPFDSPKVNLPMFIIKVKDNIFSVN